MTDWQPPVEFDGFRVIRLLGAGAMGRVYLARETMLERDVAVKFIAAEQPEPATLERFLIEARAVARLQHPNVVSVYRIGSIDGRPYVVSELVTGKALDQLETPLPWKRALAIALGLARGLAAAQARGILHRDIKPANVMVTDAGEVKLVDFGIAKLVDTLPSAELAASESAPSVVMLESAATVTDLAISTPAPPSPEPLLTRAGTVLGTPRYLAPELWAGSRASLRSDVYSFGIVVYELCAGLGSSGQARDRHTPPLRTIASDVPVKLAEVIDRCVALDPDARYASALEVREALERASAELTATPVSLSAPRLVPGELIAQRYEVLRALSVIETHVAYEVLDRELDDACTLVLLDAPDSQRMRAIRQDVRLARRLSHPNAARVLDLGQHGTSLFITTEHVHGPTLREVMRGSATGEREALTFGRKVDLVLQIAAALGTAHRLGIAHRAVRAELVVIEPQRAVLRGFGLIAVAGDALDDQRAWAALAYELLASEPPTSPPAPLQLGDEHVRLALDGVLARALSPSPSDRYATLDAAAEAFAFAARGTARITAAIPRVVVEEPSRVATTLVFVPGTIDGTGESRVDALEVAITELGGTIVSSRPDELVAMFGVPRALGDDVVRAARAAHALIERVPGGRVGLSTGRIEGTQHGEALRRTLELVNVATPGDVIASDTTVRHLRGRFATVEIPNTLASSSGSSASANSSARASSGTSASASGSSSTSANSSGSSSVSMNGSSSTSANSTGSSSAPVSGMSSAAANPRERTSSSSLSPLRLHRVLPNASERGQPKRGGRGGASMDALSQPPLHGRATELEQIELLVLGAFEQRAVRTALILGPPGIGKSRLRLELERRLADRRDVEWLVGRANPLGGGVPFGLLRDASREWFAVVEAAVASGQPAASAARRWLEERASLRPVVIAIDDLHWADDASRELIDALRRDLDQVPVGLLLFGRPGHAPAGDVDLAIELRPLDVEAARQLLLRLAPDASTTTIESVIARAGGSPFFLEELAHHILESGTDTRDLPASVELAIQARLDQLPPTERRVAVAAAVIGRELDRGALEAALAGEPLAADELDRALAELERREVLARHGDRYAFHHVLIREVAYSHTSELARRRLHAALAGYYDARVARHRRDPALLLALANHRDAAGDRMAARDAYRAAGELALSLAAYREANLALARAEELSDGHDAALLELAGDALLQLDSVAATDRLERALALASSPPAQARVLYKLGTAAYHRSEFATAVTLFERGLAQLEPVDGRDRDTTLVAARLLAMLGSVISYDMGDHRRGLPHAERAVALFEQTGDLLELAGGLSRLGGAYLRAGRWTDRLRCNLRHLQIAETLGDLDRQLMAHVNLGINYHSVGKLDEALAHTRKGLDFSIRCGRATTRALAHNNLGVILADLDQPDAARKELLEALELAQRTGYTRFLSETYSTLALLDLRAGDLASAEYQARRSADDARAAQSPLYEGVAERILAGIADAAGKPVSEVRALLASAHAKIGDDDYEQARTTALEAKLAARAGRPDAAALRDRALAVFELLGAALDIAKIDDLADVR